MRISRWQDGHRDRPSPPMSRPRRFLVLGICCMSLFIASMDTTIINVALPSISHDLGAPISGLQWTIDAYIVVLAPFSALIERRA